MERSKRITINPRQCGGQPCVRGMRVRVQDVMELLRDGMATDQILKQLPYLEDEDVLACLEFVAKDQSQ
jgi:uncharacterized protein (DUF433 family)